MTAATTTMSFSWKKNLSLLAQTDLMALYKLFIIVKANLLLTRHFL